MMKEITRTITWHSAETAPKDGKNFTTISPIGKIRGGRWSEHEKRFLPYFNNDFTHWTRDELKP